MRKMLGRWNLTSIRSHYSLIGVIRCRAWSDRHIIWTGGGLEKEILPTIVPCACTIVLVNTPRRYRPSFLRQPGQLLQALMCATDSASSDKVIFWIVMVMTAKVSAIKDERNIAACIASSVAPGRVISEEESTYYFFPFLRVFSGTERRWILDNWNEIAASQAFCHDCWPDYLQTGRLRGFFVTFTRIGL